jgi:hypothetical protein
MSSLRDRLRKPRPETYPPRGYRVGETTLYERQVPRQLPTGETELLALEEDQLELDPVGQVYGLRDLASPVGQVTGLRELEPNPVGQVHSLRDLESPSVPIGAVEAKPGSKLYELAQRTQQPAPGRATEASAKARESTRRQQVFARLQQKAVRGYGQPGEGSVALSALPAALRKHVKPGDGGPAIGWLPDQLDDEERLLLQQLQMLGQREADAVSAQNDAEMGGVRQ